MFNPNENLIGGYSSADGTIEFYGRINALLKPDFRVVDYGAGRGSWFFEDACEYRRSIRDLKSKVQEVIGVDVDPAVLSNPTTSRNIQLHKQDRPLPLDDESIDLIVCDYVLEHLALDDLAFLKQEATRLLKPGGFFCARTPHYWHYVCVGARLSKLSMHTDLLRTFQPDRKMQDVFPTQYQCNTHRQVARRFSDWKNYSYTYTPEPSYFMGSKYVSSVLSLVHKLAPSNFSGNLFVFLQKP